MNNRNYNIYFSTHTISGIIISAVLFVIFFAGSFSFFKNEISNWQRNVSASSSSLYDLDFNRVVDSLKQKHNLYGRNVSFYAPHGSARLGISISESKDTSDKKPGAFFYINASNYKTIGDYKQSYDLGEFLYRLHFLAQVNQIGNLGFPLGYYIAGIVAFMFLFALITGLLLHWNKIVSNFYLFRPWEKLKTVWTDLHTALGVISFPFLFVFAVTGSFFLISYPLFTQPVTALQYGGSQDSLYKDLGYAEREVFFMSKPLATTPDINSFVKQTKQKWSQTEMSNIALLNYGDQSMQVSIEAKLPRAEKFIGHSHIVYEAASHKILEAEPLNKPTGYSDVVQTLVYDLHFGNYGGYALKILYFLLGICGCVVIISGVLIWLTARNKKSIPEKKRKFNEWLTQIYLAICLSMFPVTAATFIAVKIFPQADMNFIYHFYFWSWLTVSTLFLIRRDNYKTNRDALLSGAIIGLAIPVVNGVVTGNWLISSWRKGYHDILVVDLFWVFVAAGSFICWWLIVKKQKGKVAKLSGTLN